MNSSQTASHHLSGPHIADLKTIAHFDRLGPKTFHPILIAD